jgi:uncharacterized protein with NRDE domain
MCTLIAIHRRIPGAPLVVAANRDEFFDRPSEGPALREISTLWNARGGWAVAPLDIRAGGTWLGLGSQGLFAAVTNRRCPDPDPERRSRGLVVMEALAAQSAVAAAKRFAELPERAYNPFNALVADREQAFALVYQDAPKLNPLPPGAHVIGNGDPNAREIPKLARVMDRAERAARLPVKSALDSLADTCREHGEEGETTGASLDDTCVHLEGYGTRSSVLLVLADRIEGSRFLYADGPPCTHDYQDFTPLLHELSRRASYEVGETPTREAS